MAPYVWYLLETAGVYSTFFLHTDRVIDVTRFSLHVVPQQNGCHDLISYLEVYPTCGTLQALESQGKGIPES